jgi:hypothetical protein
LTELERICAEYPLNRQDPDMRDRVAKEVEEVVVGGYRTFFNKCQGKQLEKCEWFVGDVQKTLRSSFRMMANDTCTSRPGAS